MGKIKNLIAGFTGAIALNMLHEAIRKQGDNVPYIHLLGEDALNKGLMAVGEPITNENTLYEATLATDVVSNALYYSLIGTGKSKYIWPKALGLGLSAGIGAIKLPEATGVDHAPVARNAQVKALTIGYYVFGALVTALTLKMLK
ncbi:hypothetical protein [Pedobacter sp. ASV12]|uniref:hypothetical protein n=1 Tax=Pedobacter sp. ASV12 TaxID=2795120 RepID=UPI0018EB4E50|nr:hypothetical protein [Pedobacter sp. ASV12]